MPVRCSDCQWFRYGVGSVGECSNPWSPWSRAELIVAPSPNTLRECTGYIKGEPMRRAARVDDNQGGIVAVFKALGAEVVDTSHVGEGFPDLLVGYRGKVHMVEIKDGSKPPSRRMLTGPQRVFHAAWERIGCPVHVVRSEDEAIALLGGRRQL